MLVKEYRIPLPLTLEEYRIAQLYMLDKKSRLESHGESQDEERSGVEIIVNEPYTDGPGGDGQYTKKIFHVGPKLPGWLRAFLPAKSLYVVEEAWNAFPYTRTKFTSPLVEKFILDVETMYAPDTGTQENIFGLKGAELSRQVDFMDIRNDTIDQKHYLQSEDPKLFQSQKTGRGPLPEDWIKTSDPIMCAYKVCRVEFKYWGVQSKVERFVHAYALRRVMLVAHRQAWCWLDEWIDLTLEDIRKMEAETQKLLMTKMGGGEEPPNLKSMTSPSTTSLITREVESDSDDSDDEFYDAQEFSREDSDSSEATQTLDSFSAEEEHALFVVHCANPGMIDATDTQAGMDADFATFCSYMRHCTPDTARLLTKSIRCDLDIRETSALVSALRPKGSSGDTSPEGILFLAMQKKLFQQACDGTIAQLNAEYNALPAKEETPIHIVGDAFGTIVVYKILTERCFELNFKVAKVFSLGSPLGLYLTLTSGGTTASFPGTGYYNLYQSTDPLAHRVEPFLVKEFAGENAITVPTHRHLPAGFAATHSLESAVRRIGIDKSVATRWWGRNRIDFELHSPSGTSGIPSGPLMSIMHASYWENKDAISFVVRHIVSEYSEFPIENARASFPFPDDKPRWNKRHLKIQRLAANHRAHDRVVTAGSSAVLKAKFTYGKLGMVRLKDENVSIYLLPPSAASWSLINTVETDKQGKISYEVPPTLLGAKGTYHLKLLVLGDNSFAAATLFVVEPKPKAVIFSIDGSFADSLSLSGANPRVRPGAVDVVRHWQNLGCLIVYVSARPDIQKSTVVTWMASHNFPQGFTWFCDTIISASQAEARKLDLLQSLQSQCSWTIQATYGQGRDVGVYESLGVTPDKIFAFNRKKGDTKCVAINSYSDHLAALQSV